MSATGAAPRLPEFVRQIISTAITDTFALAIYLVVLSGVIVALIPHLPLRDRQTMVPSPDKDEAEIEGAVHL